MSRNNPSLNVREISLLTELETLRDQWEVLFQSMRARNPFLSWAWLCSWAEQYVQGDRQLFVLRVSDGKGKVIGIAPFYLSLGMKGPFRYREIHFLGTPEAGSDYLDLLAVAGKEEQVAEEVYRHLFTTASHKWDSLCLTDIPAHSRAFMVFRSRLEAAGKGYELEPSAYCPVFCFPETVENMLDHMSRERRRQFKRDYNTFLENEDYTSETVVVRKENVDSVMEQFSPLYSKRWPLTREDFYSLLRSYLSRSSKEITNQMEKIFFRGELIVATLHIIVDKTIYSYARGVDQEKIGSTNVVQMQLRMVIEEGMKNGCTKLDSLKGTEQYKFFWANTATQSLTLRVDQRRVSSLLAAGYRALVRIGKVILR